MSSVKFMVGNPTKPTELIHYSQLSCEDKQILTDWYHDVVLQDKVYYKLETRQIWRTSSCHIFHERYYKRVINNGKKSRKLSVTVDRTVNNHISCPKRYVSFAGIYDADTGEELVKPLKNWREFYE